jgi:hypothetical protein
VHVGLPGAPAFTPRTSVLSRISCFSSNAQSRRSTAVCVCTAHHVSLWSGNMRRVPGDLAPSKTTACVVSSGASTLRTGGLGTPVGRPAPADDAIVSRAAARGAGRQRRMQQQKNMTATALDVLRATDDAEALLHFSAVRRRGHRVPRSWH